MKATTLSAILIVLAAMFVIAADTNPVHPAGLTVHEWGTFTSVAGVDGSSMDWDSLRCNDDLPQFVNAERFRGFKWTVTGNVRMETPVLYFYSQRDVTARVKVQFPQGAMTEWYPKAENISSAGFTNGSIAWDNIVVQPRSTASFPKESAPSRYYAARETDASPLTVGDQHEKFLFYRGVGRLQVPLSARVSDDGKVAVENRGTDDVPLVILFENRGGHLGFRNVGVLTGSVTLDAPALDGSLSQLLFDLETNLVAQGLYPKEARAMVETWKDSWFEEGSRLIYVVPQHLTDTILPLQVEPAPEQTTRVFVGRIELITQQTMRSVREALAKNDTTTLNRYGRFLEPIFARMGLQRPTTASYCP
jgi:hypothetical protein